MPITFGSAFKPVLDQLRALGGAFGLRPYTVFVRVRTSAGDRPGAGNTYLDNDGGPDVQMTVGRPPLGPQPVMVKMLSNRDIIASGGLYRDRDLRVGPITPTVGLVGSTFDPLQFGRSGTEIFWLVVGGDMAPGGSWHTRIQVETTALHTYLVLRATGTQP